ncbi:hypothetical protein C0993_002055 [Termitomyces sp. T159_Od127]|nr:hypothetical protein C0993_002055 [Termitomyces sp. T159_Od127]
MNYSYSLDSVFSSSTSSYDSSPMFPEELVGAAAICAACSCGFGTKHSLAKWPILPLLYVWNAADRSRFNACKELQAVYEENGHLILIALMHQFYEARHNPDKLICDYINLVIQIARQLKAIDVELEYETIIDVLILNLDEQWSNFAAMLSMAIGTLNIIVDATGALIDEEGEQKAITDQNRSLDHALVEHGKVKYHYMIILV